MIPWAVWAISLATLMALGYWAGLGDHRAHAERLEILESRTDYLEDKLAMLLEAHN